MRKRLNDVVFSLSIVIIWQGNILWKKGGEQASMNRTGDGNFETAQSCFAALSGTFWGKEY